MALTAGTYRHDRLRPSLVGTHASGRSKTRLTAARPSRTLRGSYVKTAAHHLTLPARYTVTGYNHCAIATLERKTQRAVLIPTSSRRSVTRSNTKPCSGASVLTSRMHAYCWPSDAVNTRKSDKCSRTDYIHRRRTGFAEQQAGGQ